MGWKCSKCWLYSYYSKRWRNWNYHSIFLASSKIITKQKVLEIALFSYVINLHKKIFFVIILIQKCRYRIMAIMSPCHGEDAGSIPVTCSNLIIWSSLCKRGFFFWKRGLFKIYYLHKKRFHDIIHMLNFVKDTKIPNLCIERKKLWKTEKQLLVYFC